jgi:hypothetical protein
MNWEAWPDFHRLELGKKENEFFPAEPSLLHGLPARLCK